jgi:hypothetical protein
VQLAGSEKINFTHAAVSCYERNYNKKSREGFKLKWMAIKKATKCFFHGGEVDKMLRKHEQVAHWTCMRDFLPLSPFDRVSTVGEKHETADLDEMCARQ